MRSSHSQHLWVNFFTTLTAKIFGCCNKQARKYNLHCHLPCKRVDIQLQKWYLQKGNRVHTDQFHPFYPRINNLAFLTLQMLEIWGKARRQNRYRKLFTVIIFLGNDTACAWTCPNLKAKVRSYVPDSHI